MDPQLQQLYKYMFDGWRIINQSWWRRTISKLTNKYRVTLLSPIEHSEAPDGDWRYKVTLFLEPAPRKIAKALEVCDIDGKPRKLEWYFRKLERHQL